MGNIIGASILGGTITLLLVLAIPIAISVLIIKKMIDYAAKKFAEEFSKRNIRF